MTTQTTRNESGFNSFMDKEGGLQIPGVPQTIPQPPPEDTPMTDKARTAPPDVTAATALDYFIPKLPHDWALYQLQELWREDGKKYRAIIYRPVVGGSGFEAYGNSPREAILKGNYPLDVRERIWVGFWGCLTPFVIKLRNGLTDSLRRFALPFGPGLLA